MKKLISFSYAIPPTDTHSRTSILLIIILHVVTVSRTALDDNSDTDNITYSDDTCVLNDVQHPDVIFYKHICGNHSKTIVIFKNSKLWHVPAIFDEYPLLRSLDMTNNSVESIAPKTFANATKLVSLFMSNNNISEINDNAFDGARNLFTLLLSTSNVSIIEPNSFYGLSNLIKLDLGFNNIEMLPDGIFDPLVKIESIRLNDNQIQRISRNLFDKNSKLKRIYLSGNNIFELNPSSLIRTNVMAIDLANNPVKNVDFSTLKHLQSLTLTNTSLEMLCIPLSATDISAANNEIYAIELPTNFNINVDRPQLARLNLSNNVMHDFQNLSKLTKLEVLDLSFNELPTIDFSTMHSLKNLHQLSLFGNPMATFNATALQHYLPNINVIELSPFNWSTEYKTALADKLRDENIFLIYNEHPSAPPPPHTSNSQQTSTTHKPSPSNNNAEIADELVRKFNDFEIQFKRVLTEIDYLGQSVNTTMKPYDLLTNLTTDLIKTHQVLLTMLIDAKEREKTTSHEMIEENLQFIKNMLLICIIAGVAFLCWKAYAFIAWNRISVPWNRRRVQTEEPMQPILHDDSRDDRQNDL